MLIYNEELWNTYLMFENRDELNTNWYNQSFYDTNSRYNKNGCIDKLFGHFNFVCYLMKTKQISKEEISLYKYYIKQTLRDYNSLLYLYNLFYYVIYLDFNDNNRVEFLDFSSLIDRHPYKYLLLYSFKNIKDKYNHLFLIKYNPKLIVIKIMEDDINFQNYLEYLIIV